jgi:hypothetical protein
MRFIVGIVSQVVVEAADLGRKSSSRKKSSAFVMKMKSVVAQSAPKKLYRVSHVHDRNRWGFEGLLSQVVMYASRRDGEDLIGNAVLWKMWQMMCVVCISERRELWNSREGEHGFSFCAPSNLVTFSLFYVAYNTMYFKITILYCCTIHHYL